MVVTEPDLRHDRTCPTCYDASPTPTARYCAPKRCYCGHPECPAFASYVDMSVVPLPEQGVPTGRGRR